MNFETTANGIEYEYGVVYQGAHFILYTTDQHTPEQINTAKADLRKRFDVITIKVANDHQWDERYKCEISAHPLVKHLRWFEIDTDDDKKIHQHRLKGTPIEVYINLFVLPNVQQTKAKNIELYGEEIINE